MIHAGQCILGSTVTVLGITFKEDYRDLRNSKVIEIIQELQTFRIKVQASAPLADSEEAYGQYNLNLAHIEKLKPAAAVIVAVSHAA